jgi:hypothetical protein
MDAIANIISFKVTIICKITTGTASNSSSPFKKKAAAS